MVGATRVGKTSLLRSMIEQDIKAGRGVFVIDPHGDLHAALLANLPARARARLVAADIADFNTPFRLNILKTGAGQAAASHPAIERGFIVSQLIELFKSVYGHNPEAFGPMFEIYFRSALMLLMEGGGPEVTLLDFERVFGSRSYGEELLAECSDPAVPSFWANIAEKAGGEASLENVAPYVIAKRARLSGSPLVRPIVCRPDSSLDIPAALAGGKVVLVNLAKGLAGPAEAAMVGEIITIRLFAVAMARIRLPERERRPMRVYLDEFQTHAGPVLGEMMAEAGKFGLSLVLANQPVAQLQGRGADIAHAILANAGNLLAFRQGSEDAEIIARWLGPNVSPRDVADLPNHHFIACLLADQRPALPEILRLPARR